MDTAMPHTQGQELEVVIKFKNLQGDYIYDVDSERRHVEEAAKELAGQLKKFGYHFHDVKRLDSNDQNKMRRHFIITLDPRQTPEELKRRLESIGGNRSWTYYEVY